MVERDSILRLNDDCLVEIFEYLDILSWCKLRKTCTRMRSISDFCFEKMVDKCEAITDYISNDRFRLLALNDFQEILEGFGHLLSKLTINSNDFDTTDEKKFNKIFYYINEYCLELKELKIVSVTFPMYVVRKCNRLLSNLEKLIIDKSMDDDETFTECIATCKMLKELELSRMKYIQGDFLHETYPQLESVTFRQIDNVKYESVRLFICKNQQLKRLKFIKLNTFADDLYLVMSMNLPYLESISVRTILPNQSINLNNLMSMLNLKHLKKLEINTAIVESFIDGLALNNVIECLHLSPIIVTYDIMRPLLQLKTLKILKFSLTSPISNDICLALAKELPLIELHIMECSTMSPSQLKEFIEHSSTLKKIIFIRYNDSPSLTNNQFMELIEARKKNVNKERLNLFVEIGDFHEIKENFMWSNNDKIITDYSHIISLLPLCDKNEITTMYEFGASRSFRATYHDLEMMEDDWYDDDYGFDDFDSDDDELSDEY